MSETTGGPNLTQQRVLATAIPGPKSMELQAPRQNAIVSAGMIGESSTRVMW